MKDPYYSPKHFISKLQYCATTQDLFLRGHIVCYGINTHGAISVQPSRALKLVKVLACTLITL